MNFDFFTPGSVGTIKGGMTREELRSTLGGGFRAFKKTQASLASTDAFDDLDLHVYYSPDLLVKGVEFYEGSGFGWAGCEVLGVEISYLEDLALKAGEDLEVSEWGFEIKRLGLRFYVPDVGEKDALVESVYLVLI